MYPSLWRYQQRDVGAGIVGCAGSYAQLNLRRDSACVAILR
jgi:hypothetical protein